MSDAPGPHLVAGEGDYEGDWFPAPGYWWANDVPDDYSVVWMPGMKHPESPNVYSDKTEGKWVPAFGYKRVNPESEEDLSVTWVPGMKHPYWPNVVAGEGEQEGELVPAPGYWWTSDVPGDCNVVWIPGRWHPKAPNIYTGETEGEWVPALGYKRVNPESKEDLSVTWVPGMPVPGLPNVVTNVSEEQEPYVPAPGYRWVNDDQDDFTVEWTPGLQHPSLSDQVAGEKEGSWLTRTVTLQVREGIIRKLTIDEAGIVQTKFIVDGQQELNPKHRGWYEAGGRAAEFKMGKSWYELYRPTATTSPDGYALVSFQVHHINNSRRTAPDVINVELNVDTMNGELVSIKVDHKEAGKIFMKEKAPPDPYSQIVGPALDLLEDHLKTLSQVGGLLQLPTVAKHCVNAVLANLKWQ
jgi:hypothetical protein